jgi:hypothetical protein
MMALAEPAIPLQGALFIRNLYATLDLHTSKSHFNQLQVTSPPTNIAALCNNIIVPQNLLTNL